MGICRIILFLLGLLWAYLCLYFLLAPLIIFGGIFSFFFGEEAPWFNLLEFIGFLILSIPLFLNSLLGYWIWLGWLVKFWKGTYFRVSESKFWKLSVINHFAWVLLLPTAGAMYFNILYEANFTELLCFMLLLSVWPLMVGITSLLFSRKKAGNRLEPVVMGNG